MENRLTKLTSLLLIGIMLLSTFAVSCAEKKTDTETDDTAADETTAETEDNYDENGFINDELPELNFQNQDVKILYWSDVENQEFEAEAETGEMINDDIYYRNRNAEERLGVKLNWIGTKGDGSDENIANYVNMVNASWAAGDAAYDILAGYTRTIASCALNGYTIDLLGVDYIDYTKPWWPEKLTTEATISGKLHFISGDISTNLLYMMYCVYYNKTLLDSYQVTYPTDYVASDTWTIDALIESTKNCYSDLNTNNKKDYEDFFGFTTGIYHNDAFYTGSGLKYVETNDDNQLIISEDFFSEKAYDLVAKLGPWEQTLDVYDNTLYGEDYEYSFTNGNALFTLNRAQYASKSLRSSNVSYGIVPVPKYDENQENYYTVLGNPVTFYAIDGECQYANVCGALLECFASYSYRTITYDIFELYMKVRYSEDPLNGEMYDLVRSNVSFDLGRYFNKQLSNITDIFHVAVGNNDSNWTSTAEKNRQKLTRQIESIQEQLTGTEE